MTKTQALGGYFYWAILYNGLVYGLLQRSVRLVLDQRRAAIYCNYYRQYIAFYDIMRLIATFEETTAARCNNNDNNNATDSLYWLPVPVHCTAYR